LIEFATRWRSEDDFKKWVANPVATSSEIWSFDLLESIDA
jgi:hypothetical protein